MHQGPVAQTVNLCLCILTANNSKADTYMVPTHAQHHAKCCSYLVLISQKHVEVGTTVSISFQGREMRHREMK